MTDDAELAGTPLAALGNLEAAPGLALAWTLPLTLSQLRSVRDAALADDVPIDGQAMASWSAVPLSRRWQAPSRAAAKPLTVSMRRWRCWLTFDRELMAFWSLVTDRGRIGIITRSAERSPT